ncbi:hypothetical protein MJK95_21295, partial [Salmonella enterica subsp. enterica serovar Montevideo]|nr:hypothetical protein [Salmonella enterica subsp. enterica serovar Montevideo]
GGDKFTFHSAGIISRNALYSGTFSPSLLTKLFISGLLSVCSFILTTGAVVMAGDGDESKVDVTDIRFATALSFGIGACISCQQLRQAGEDVATVPTIAPDVSKSTHCPSGSVNFGGELHPVRIFARTPASISLFLYISVPFILSVFPSPSSCQIYS